MNKPIDELLQKEMSRKEFLATIGFGLASIAGLSGILEIFGKVKTDPKQLSNGYGASQYGR